MMPQTSFNLCGHQLRRQGKWNHFWHWNIAKSHYNEIEEEPNITEQPLSTFESQCCPAVLLLYVFKTLISQIITKDIEQRHILLWYIPNFNSCYLLYWMPDFSDNNQSEDMQQFIARTVSTASIRRILFHVLQVMLFTFTRHPSSKAHHVASTKRRVSRPCW